MEGLWAVPTWGPSSIEWEWRKIKMPYDGADPISKSIRDPLLVEREKTHGLFETNAEYSQKLKAIMQHPYGTVLLCPVHREALDMIALKLSRILSGQANYKDHWDDIAGYAKLASEACSS